MEATAVPLWRVKVCIRVLGPFGADRDGVPIPLGGRRQRAVLALLAAEGGRVVSVDRMIEEIWQGAPPARALTSLQAYVSNLRRLLEPDRAPRTPATLLVSAPPGYALRLPDDAVDARRFERLLHDARAGAVAPDAALHSLAEALALWQGPAYAEFADETWAAPEIARLHELRLVARESHVAAALRTGDVAAAVPDAELLTRDEPLREEAWRLHALALWAGGRQADALTTLRAARAYLAEEVGLDPGPALTDLEAAILAGRTELLRAATRVAEGRGERRAEGLEERFVVGPQERLARGAEERLAGEPEEQPGVGPQARPAEQPVARQTPRPADTRTPPPAAPLAPVGGFAAAAGPASVLAPAALALSATPTPDPLFVGRDVELGRLLEVARRAAVAGPAVALVTGEAGLGKSALLERLAARLAADGWLVAVGRATDAEGAPPAWPWVEMLRTVAAAVPPSPVTARILAPLLADDARTGEAERDVDAGRFRLHREIWQWLAEAARARPLAVLLDDLHWADAETLAVLGGFADLPPGSRLLLVTAHRPHETDGRLADRLAVLARHAPLRLPLPGLPEAAVAAVVEAAGVPSVDAETVAALTERTGGNPFYVRETARLLAGEGALVALSEVPEGVRDVLRRRLARLPESAVSVLRLAAVAGRETSVDLLVASGDSDEDDVLAALEAGILAGLLTEPAPEQVRFAHALVRDTLLADLSGLRAARLHGRIAASLEKLTPGDVSALAHHFARAAGSATAAKAVHYCLRAAELAEARYAHDTAAELLTTARDCFDRIPASDRIPVLDGSAAVDGVPELARSAVLDRIPAPDPSVVPDRSVAPAPNAAATPGYATAAADRDAERIALLGRLLRAQVRAGAVMAARATQQQAIEHAAGTGREDLLVRALTAWSEPTPWQTRPYGVVDEPLVALLRRALAFPGLAPADRCGLLLALCAERSDLSDPDVRAAAAEALDLADDVGLRARALAALVRESDAERDPRALAEHSAQLVELAAAHDLPAFRWYGSFVQATVAAVEGDVEGAYRRLDAAADLARAYRMPGPLVVGETARATRAAVEGRWADAERRYAEATDLMARQGSPHAEGFHQVAVATVRFTQGRLGDFLPQARRLADAYGPMTADVLAAALCAAGELDEARALLERAAPLRPDYFFKVFATFRAATVVALADRPRAEELYAALLPYRDAAPPSAGFSVAIPPVARTLADLARLLGRTDEAATHARRAAEIEALWRGGTPKVDREA